jgi:hypothetical protein
VGVPTAATYQIEIFGTFRIQTRKISMWVQLLTSRPLGSFMEWHLPQ